MFLSARRLKTALCLVMEEESALARECAPAMIALAVLFVRLQVGSCDCLVWEYDTNSFELYTCPSTNIG